MKTIGIVREMKNEWERRVPFIPKDVQSMINEMGVKVKIQPSDLRIFPDQLYREAGAVVEDNLRDCELIFGIKEIKIKDLLAEKVYFYFSHTIKGQSYNMAMLQKLLDLKCTLIDYERMMNTRGQRQIYFSVHAGLAGIVESLWALGQQLAKQNIRNPFEKIRQTYRYNDLSEIKAVFRQVGRDIQLQGLPHAISPMVIGITGYGNVARGVQDLLDLLPVKQIRPEQLADIVSDKNLNTIYKVVFKEEDMVEPKDSGQSFELQDYYTNPEKYRSKFAQYLPFLTMLINASFWDTPYPRHVSNASLRRLFSGKSKPKLLVIGDISCDIDGGVECTVKATDPGEPVFTYHPLSGEVTDGFAPNGVVVMSVDNLPSELPKDASVYFSGALKKLIPEIIKADYSEKFERLTLPDSLKKAVIVYQGALTPEYEYLQKYLEASIV